MEIPSLLKHTLNLHDEEVKCNLKGRHDPCVALRGTVVCEAMMALTLADMTLLNMGKKMEHLRSIYKG
jgi:chorismate synthase